MQDCLEGLSVSLKVELVGPEICKYSLAESVLTRHERNTSEF